MNDNRHFRVALFNPIIAHYRSGLLRELTSDRRCEFFWFADSQDNDTDIPAVDLSFDPHFSKAPCSKLGRFNWQHGTLRAAFGNYDTFVFLGSATWISSWLGAIVARFRGKRVLFWTHGWTRRDGFAKCLVRNAMYKLAHGLLLYGERARHIGIGHGFDPNRLHVMYNSLDFDAQQQLRLTAASEEIDQLRAQLFGEIGIPVVIATARLTPVKRFDLLIRAVGILARQGHPLHLLIVGDGPQKALLETLAAEENVSAVFVGACYNEKQLAKYFLCANVTVSPGNVGLTCMHSLGYGVPVITHNNPAEQMPEWEAIIPTVNGELFNQGQTSDLAGVIRRWTATPTLPREVREQCLASLRSSYHPRVQSASIVRAVLGSSQIPSMDNAPL